MPDGDATEVGENGFTLSGGQKARLALARAVYMVRGAAGRPAASAGRLPPDVWLAQDKDVYLLDDPLAAVDAQVARHLVRRCVLELLAGKTRILCTHRVELVEAADLVVLMDNGTVVNAGKLTVKRPRC